MPEELDQSAELNSFQAPRNAENYLPLLFAAFPEWVLAQESSRLTNGDRE